MALTFINTEAALTHAILAQVEGRLGIVLPPDLKAHYLRFNGGRPVPRFFPKDGDWIGVHFFFAMNSENPGVSLERAYEDLINGNEVFPKGFIPFAVDEGGDQFLYSLKEEKTGQIMFCQWDYYDDPERFVVFLASDLATFLAALTEPDEDSETP